MTRDCPRCGLVFEREEGYWLGAVILNTMATTTVLAILMALTVGLTWPDIPGIPLIAVSIPLAIALPYVLYPISKTLWVAIDLCAMHPMRPWRRRKPETDD